MPIRIAVGSTNPTKVGAVTSVTQALWEDVQILSHNVASSVRDQPLSKEETEQGARNRARAVRAATGADWSFGLEGGVHPDGPVVWLGGCVACIDPYGREWTAQDFNIPLPPAIAARLMRGEELGPVMDEILGQSDTKKKHGAVGFLSKGLIPREDGWRQTVIRVLVPFLHPDLYAPLFSSMEHLPSATAHPRSSNP